MKLTKKDLQELVAKVISSYILEADDKKDDEKAGDEAEENPFAPAGGDEGGDKKDDKEGGETKQPAGIPIKFNISAVKKYNDAPFLSDAGVVKSISKQGIVVTTQPDNIDILVNFDDISESAKKFFRKK